MMFLSRLSPLRCLLATLALATTTAMATPPNQTDLRPVAQRPTTSVALPVEGTMPSLDGVTQWLNSPPLSKESLKGKVVLIDFWTYTCINCLNILPYVKAWHKKYSDQGLVIIGVHAPEFPRERDIGNVKKAMRDLGIDFPVAVDNNFTIWRKFNNQFWPALYFIDADGKIRAHHFGEGNYAKSEKIIQTLLQESRALSL